MNIQDEKPFKELMLMIASTWDKPITGAKSKAWWMVFKRYEFADLEAGVFKHMSDEHKGKFDPKPADILVHMPEIKQTVIEHKGSVTGCENCKALVDKYHPVTGSYFKAIITNEDNLKVEK
jgi:hypothetical protein